MLTASRQYGNLRPSNTRWSDKLQSGLQRFMARVIPEPNSGCWLWAGSIKPLGYGSWGHGGRMYQAHRFAYEAMVGPIPEGMHIDHLCRVRCCVNPKHLEPVTPRENVRRAMAACRGSSASNSHCRYGHELSAANTYIRPTGARTCRICNAAARLKHRRTKATYAAEQAIRSARWSAKNRAAVTR